MKRKKDYKIASFRSQMAQSMAELESIMNAGQSLSGDGRFTVRTIRVQEPGKYSPERIRSFRIQLGVSQAIFAQLLGVSQVLVRSWERGARTPAASACRLMDIARDNPRALSSLILSDREESTGGTRKPNAKHVGTVHYRRASAA